MKIIDDIKEFFKFLFLMEEYKMRGYYATVGFCWMMLTLFLILPMAVAMTGCGHGCDKRGEYEYVHNCGTCHQDPLIDVKAVFPDDFVNN